MLHAEVSDREDAVTRGIQWELCIFQYRQQGYHGHFYWQRCRRCDILVELGRIEMYVCRSLYCERVLAQLIDPQKRKVCSLCSWCLVIGLRGTQAVWDRGSSAFPACRVTLDLGRLASIHGRYRNHIFMTLETPARVQPRCKP